MFLGFSSDNENEDSVDENSNYQAPSFKELSENWEYQNEEDDLAQAVTNSLEDNNINKSLQALQDEDEDISLAIANSLNIPPVTVSLYNDNQQSTSNKHKQPNPHRKNLRRNINSNERIDSEIDIKLKNKSSPFPSNITIQQASKLKKYDKIDHRDNIGKWILSTIIDINGTNLKIHYDGWSSKWDIWCDYTQNLHRFAIAHSISSRPVHTKSFIDIEEGHHIDINPTLTRPGWKYGEITRLDPFSGQIQV